ncbi:MAG: nickel pincer cofactor biosynthesis protein LarC [Acidobacteriaceae bacterium]
MRIAYLDCFAGVSGDMLLGALMDAGVAAEVLTEATAALKLGASLTFEKVDRSGITCTKVHVMESGELAEKKASTQTHSHEQAHDHGHAHDHDHKQEHAHGRSLRVIRELIHGAALADAVKRRAIRTFELLGESEAKIHNVDVEKIHFHEVGAVDAIVDIVAACAGIEALGVDAWHCSALNVGSGMVECAHGTFPVPAPATADLLRGFPTYSAHVEKELVTPTGAALVRMLEPAFGAQPAMRVERIGYGAGTRNPKGFPNALRLSVGEAESVSAAGTESVTVLETALDDLSPQVLAWVAESLLAAGALDVMLTPVVMKKGRPGTLLTVLCNGADSESLTAMILRETTTLGVRVRQDQRQCLERHHVTVSTEFGEIRVKVGVLRGEVMNAAPEFEDCRVAAVRCEAALKRVQQAAMVAYAQQREKTSEEESA